MVEHQGLTCQKVEHVDVKRDGRKVRTCSAKDSGSCLSILSKKYSVHLLFS